VNLKWAEHILHAKPLCLIWQFFSFSKSGIRVVINLPQLEWIDQGRDNTSPAPCFEVQVIAEVLVWFETLFKIGRWLKDNRRIGAICLKGFLLAKWNARVEQVRLIGQYL